MAKNDKLMTYPELTAALFKALVVQFCGDECDCGYKLNDRQPKNVDCCRCTDARVAIAAAMRSKTPEMEVAIESLDRMGLWRR